MRIIVFDEVSDVIDFISVRFAERFAEKGHEVLTVHMKHINESLPELEQFIGGGVDFVFCINNAAFAFDRLLKMPFWDTVGAPLFNYLLDHPVSYTELLREAPKVCFPVCVDGNHPDYILKHCPNIQNSGFLPLGGAEVLPKSYIEAHEENIRRENGTNNQIVDDVTESCVPVELELEKQICKEINSVSALTPWQERKTDVLFVGYSRNIGADADNFAKALAKYMMENTSLTYEEAMADCYKKHGRQYLGNMDFETALVRYMSVAIDVMGSFRQKMVRVLVKAGIDVTVYGSMWDKEKDLMDSPNFHYMGVTSPGDCIRLMHDTKVVLNCMPWFKNGSHDRIPNAMMAGAISVTDPSKYLLENFEDKKDLFYFDLNKIDELPSLVSDILTSDGLNELRQNALTKAKEAHLWKYRADELLAIFED